MPTIRIPPGTVRGESRASVPGRWHTTNLIRWQQGVMKPVGGWERVTRDPLLSVPRIGLVWSTADFARHAAYICDGKVWRENNSVYVDITPTDFIDANSTSGRGYGSGNYGILDYGMDDEDRGSGSGDIDPRRLVRFSIDNWNDELLFSSSADGRIFVWDPATPTTPPAVALNAPLFCQGFVVTEEHHLMVFGPQGNPNRVVWSDQDNRTIFDETIVTGQAGFKDLEGSGNIICGVKIPAGILVFTSTAVWLGRYIGQPYYYGFTKIAEGCTPISAHAIAVAGARAYWMGQQSFWIYEGGVVSPLPCTLGNDPFEALDRNAAPRRATAGFCGLFPEIWFFWPENQGLAPVLTENNRYSIYNFDRGQEWWTDGYMGRSFYMSSPLDGVPIAGDEQTNIYHHEIGYLAEGQPRTDMVYAEVGNISFDDGANNWQVNQFQLDSPLGPESIKFEFRGKRVRGGPEVFLQTCIPRTNGFVDAHFTARDFSMRIEGRVDGPWAIGAMVFNDVKKRGPV